MKNNISNEDRYNITHVCKGLSKSSGGTSSAIVRLTDFLADFQCLSIELLSFEISTEPVFQSKSSKVKRQYVRQFLCSGSIKSCEKRTITGQLSQRPISVIHNHGLWSSINYLAGRFAQKKQIPLVWQPHGMLSERALAYKRWKKTIAWEVGFKRSIERARLLVATSEAELSDFRRMSLVQPVAVIPNGIDIPSETKGNSTFDVSQCKRRALFLSRIHPIKGIPTLLKAWAKVQTDGWELFIVGPSEDSYLKELKNLAASLRITKNVFFKNEIYEEEKSQMFISSNLFILPTLSENFGIAVAEALSFGVPVITTHSAPWHSLEEHGCGWWIPEGVDPLCEALSVAMSCSLEELQAMGERGRVLARIFDWAAVSLQMCEAYMWLLGKADTPTFVHLD